MSGEISYIPGAGISGSFYSRMLQFFGISPRSAPSSSYQDASDKVDTLKNNLTNAQIAATNAHAALANDPNNATKITAANDADEAVITAQTAMEDAQTVLDGTPISNQLDTIDNKNVQEMIMNHALANSETKLKETATENKQEGEIVEDSWFKKLLQQLGIASSASNTAELTEIIELDATESSTASDILNLIKKLTQPQPIDPSTQTDQKNKAAQTTQTTQTTQDEAQLDKLLKQLLKELSQGKQTTRNQDTDTGFMQSIKQLFLNDEQKQSNKIKESLNALEKYINNKPDSQTRSELKNDIQDLRARLEQLKTNTEQQAATRHAKQNQSDQNDIARQAFQQKDTFFSEERKPKNKDEKQDKKIPDEILQRYLELMSKQKPQTPIVKLDSAVEKQADPTTMPEPDTNTPNTSSTDKNQANTLAPTSTTPPLTATNIVPPPRNNNKDEQDKEDSNESNNTTAGKLVTPNIDGTFHITSTSG